MKAYPLTLYQTLTSNQDLQKEIDALEAQMQGIQPDSPEYLFDQLNLAREKEMQKIREEHPNLDPLNPADGDQLYQLIAQDPACQQISQQMRELSEAFPSECTKWGIPIYWTKAIPVS